MCSHFSQLDIVFNAPVDIVAASDYELDVVLGLEHEHTVRAKYCVQRVFRATRTVANGHQTMDKGLT